MAKQGRVAEYGHCVSGAVLNRLNRQDPEVTLYENFVSQEEALSRREVGAV